MNGPFRLLDTRLRTLAIMVLLLVLATGVFLQLQGGPGTGSAGFRNWQVLAVSSSLPGEDIDRTLESAGFAHRLSRYTVRGTASSFGGTKLVNPQEFLAVLPPEDPRITPWLASLPGIFQDRAGAWLLWYLPAADPLSAGPREKLESRLSDILSAHGGLVKGRDWYLLQEASPTPGWLGPVVAALFMVVLLVFARSGPFQILGLGVACAPGITGAPLPELAFIMSACFLWAAILEIFLPALRRYVQDDQKGTLFWDHLDDPEARAVSLKAFFMYADSRALVSRMAMLTLLAVMVPVSGLFQGNGIPALGIFLVLVSAPWLMAMLQARLLQRRRERFEHRLFVPVPIMSRSNLFHTRLRKGIPWLWALGGIVTALSLLGLGGGRPEGVPGGEFPGFEKEGPANPAPRELLFASWPQGKGHSRPDPGALPDLGDFLFNQVWQESLPFLKTVERRDFTVPAFGTSLEIPVHVLVGTRVESSVQMVAHFDDEWLSGLSGGANPFGVEALILDQGYPGQLVYHPLDRVYSSPDWLLASWGITGAFFLLLWLRGKHASNRQWYDVRTSFNQVRKIAV